MFAEPLIYLFSYAAFHITRKTLSNIKTTISAEWRGTCDLGNTTCNRLKPDSVWNERNALDSESDAKLFLGALDATFLGAYSIVSIIAEKSFKKATLNKTNATICILRVFL